MNLSLDVLKECITKGRFWSSGYWLKQYPKNMGNYTSTANLCSVSKVFEKLTLKKIMEKRGEYKVNITEKKQQMKKAH